MAPLLDRHGAYLNAAEVSRWHTRIDELAARRRAETEARPQVRTLRLSMIGRIELEHPDGRRSPIRGARLRTILGLMVINAMLPKSLSYREFCRLAAGGEGDPERARKMMSMGILRLREVIGEESILNDGETPMLNPDLIEVDLIQVRMLLNESVKALREGSLVHARAALLEALSLIRSETPLPGLYDPFFEAAREEFEIALRSSVIEVAGGLLHEGDPASAQGILQQAFEMMIEDEEIVQLLQRTLDAQGKRMEAERVRVMAADAAEAQ